MNGCAKDKNTDKIFELNDELKQKKGGDVTDGIIFGGLIKGYFLKGLEEKAVELYDEAAGKNSRIKVGDRAYNFILDALCNNGKLEKALRLFDRMKEEHKSASKAYSEPWELQCDGKRVLYRREVQGSS
ncbi:hypothetical protein Ancab_012587 [Ancistrocladus abbreviatus]